MLCPKQWFNVWNFICHVNERHTVACVERLNGKGQPSFKPWSSCHLNVGETSEALSSLPVSDVESG